MSIPLENPAAHPPEKTALLLLDFHKLIINMMPKETQESLIGAMQTLLKSARANKSPVVHAMIGFDQEPIAKSKMRSNFETKYKPLMAASPEMFAEYEAFTEGAAPASHEITVSKTPGCVSALKTPELLRFLKDHGIESMIICGVITGGAVLSTAREAADLGFVTTVVEEGCWDYTPEAHDVVLHKVLPMTAWVVKAETADKLLKGKAEALESDK